MRVLCCYARLHPATADALARFAPGAELVDVAGDDFAAWEQIAARWDGTADLVLVDHDVEIHAQVLPQFGACREPWCSFPYPIVEPGHLLWRGVGCVRFTAACQQAVTPAEIQAVPGSCWACADGRPGCWRHADGRIAGALESTGISVHAHEPPVIHHKAGYGLCPCNCT